MTASKLSLLLTAALLCGTGKLDLSCPSFTASTAAKPPLVGFEPPRWTVQLGHAFRQALFWAAVASVLL